MLAARSQFVSSNGIRLHMLEWGAPTSPPVLLIHGSCAHAQWWAFVAATLADRYRVLAVDLRGHGDSDWADPTDYSIDTHARDITGLATALDLKDLRIAGHSLGGLVTIASAAALAPRLSALAIIDTTGRISS